MKPIASNIPLYAIKAPSGILMSETTATTKSECYDNLWNQMDDMFVQKYWKRAGATKAAWRRAGYKCVEVQIMELK